MTVLFFTSFLLSSIFQTFYLYGVSSILPKDVLFRFTKRQPIFQKIWDLISIYQSLNLEANFYKKRKWCGRVYSFYEPITHCIDYVADSLPNDKTVTNIKHYQNRFLIWYKNRINIKSKVLHNLFIFYVKGKIIVKFFFKKCNLLLKYISHRLISWKFIGSNMNCKMN